MNASSSAVCLYGHGHADESLDLLSTLGYPVFGHLIDGTVTKIYKNAKITSSTSQEDVTRTYRMTDMARYGMTLANWNTLRHLDLSFSLAMSVMNKKHHEIANNMRFNRVVCLHNDIGHVSSFVSMNKDTDALAGSIFCQTHRNPRNNLLWAVDSSIMIGTSRDVDTLSRFHASYSTGEFWQIVQANDIDPAYQMADLGTLLYKWMSVRNLRTHG